MSIFEQLTDRDHVFEFLAPVQSPVDVRHGGEKIEHLVPVSELFKYAHAVAS